MGTARDTNSKVWFTIADGVLSDTDWPTVDATNVHTLQYLVTGGTGAKSFTDLQTRDMTYKVVPDPTGMSCTVVASNAAHGYRIITTYIADPGRDAVLMQTTFTGPGGDQLYVRLDPLAGGTGGGGSQRNAGANSALVDANDIPVAFNRNTITNAVNRDYAVLDVYGARIVERPLERKRRLRRLGQRRPEHARLDGVADAVHIRTERACDAHCRRVAAPGANGGPRARFRYHSA